VKTPKFVNPMEKYLSNPYKVPAKKRKVKVKGFKAMLRGR